MNCWVCRLAVISSSQAFSIRNLLGCFSDVNTNKKQIHAHVPQHTHFYVYSGLENHLYCGVCVFLKLSIFPLAVAAEQSLCAWQGSRMGCEELLYPAQAPCVLTSLSECFQIQSIQNDATSLLFPPDKCINFFFVFPFFELHRFAPHWGFPQLCTLLPCWRCSSEVTLCCLFSELHYKQGFFQLLLRKSQRAGNRKLIEQESNKWANVKIFTCIVWTVNFALKVLSGCDCALKTLCLWSLLEEQHSLKKPLALCPPFLPSITWIQVVRQMEKRLRHLKMRKTFSYC